MEFSKVDIDKITKTSKFTLYMNIVLDFIRSDNKKISFMDLSGPLKVILVELVTDASILKLPSINVCCKPLCLEIYNELEANRSTFILSSEDTLNKENALVYKKVYLQDIPNLCNLISSLPSLESMEDLNKQLDRLNKHESITTGFKLHCINATLKFIKDDNQQSLRYADLTHPQAELITTLINNPDIDSDIGFGFKSFYAPLWEALKIYGSKYEFRFRNLNSSIDTQTLVLEKFNKIHEIQDDIEPMDTSDSEIFENSKSSISTSRKEKKKSKEYINSLTPAFVQDALSKIMKFYSDDAVASMTFNKLDESECYFFSNFRGVLDSKKLKSCFNKCQRLMIEKIKNVSASKTNYKLAIKKTKMWDPLDKAITFSKVPVYNPAQRIWADMITKKENIALNTTDRSVSKDKGKIQISVTTEAKEFKDKAESTRTTYKINVDKLINAAETVKENVAVYLKPNNNKNESSNKTNANVNIGINTVSSDRSDRNIKTSTSNNVNINASTVTSDGSDRKDKIVNSNMLTAQVSKLDSDRSDRSVGKDKSRSSNRLDANVSTIDSDRSDRSVNKDKRSIGISFQKGSVLDLRNSESSMNTENVIDKPEAERNKDGVAQSGQVLNNRKSKLLEAMSVPLKSDKAMKMMLVMGWEGGALGLRGEGITEPIIPALDLPKGAGLGHTPPPKSKPTNDFRIELVHVIHDFLLSDDESKTIGFQAKLTTKEVKTLNNVVQCFGNRTRMELVFGQLAIADAVMRMLHAKSILLTSSLSADKKEIRLVKVSSTSPDITNRGLRKMQRMVLIQDKLSRMSVTINLGKSVDNACSRKKSYLLLEFKIDTLVAILEFFKRSEKKMTWRAGDTMNKKKIAYIDKAVRSMNEKFTFGDTEPEMALAAQILNSMGDYELELKFLNFNTSFTITKIYNRFSPQGTSTPEEETIDNIKSVTKTATVDQNSNKLTPIESNLYSDSHTQSEATDDPSTDDVIIIEGRMSPIVVSDEENALLKSLSDAADIETDLDQTSPVIDLSVKCDNFDGNLKDLEQAIFEADDIKKEDSPSIKRSRSDSLTSDTKIPKKIKYETKKVHIVHSNYPDDMLSKENIATTQKIISDGILNSNELPLLKCHGVQDGGLVYSCHTVKSYDWLKSTLGVASDVKILDTKDVLDDGYKMSLKFNCYFDFNVDYLFSMLELYNKDLSTSKWLLLKQTVFLNHVCFVVKVDASSYFYVRSKGYCLFAGVDEVQFSIICD